MILCTQLRREFRASHGKDLRPILLSCNPQPHPKVPVQLSIYTRYYFLRPGSRVPKDCLPGCQALFLSLLCPSLKVLKVPRENWVPRNGIKPLKFFFRNTHFFLSLY